MSFFFFPSVALDSIIHPSRKRQPPEYGRLSCPIDALSSFGALEYFKGKDGKRVRAPGGERDKAHARTGAVHAGRR